MKIIKTDYYYIYIDLGEQFNNSVVKASFERTQSGADVSICSLTQVEPCEKILSDDKKNKIAKAVTEWNARLKTISFV